jgi:magnesium chelatase family protein
VTVEADVANGLPFLVVSGLPDASLHEARDRVRAAIVNSGEVWPQQRITVNLLPANLPKSGTGFDLAIAVALMAAGGELPIGPLAGMVVLGELGLDGHVRPIRGILPAVLAAVAAGIRRVVVPSGNAIEAALVPGVDVRATDTVARLASFLRGEGPLLHVPATETPDEPPGPDLADVAGQERGRWALEIAAAGGHHLALFGPPGAGKTMLAQRLPGILPPLDDGAAMEATAVHSIAGTLPSAARLIRRPPLQAPHHSASVAALVGGGSGLARPGAISLAHHGVLLLDEGPEFGAHVLDSLRQPLEEGLIRLRRAQGETVYPARVQVVLTANPCPCANSSGGCECTSLVRRRYLGRLSGPLMDRIDLRVVLEPIRAAALLTDLGPAEPSAVVAQRVVAARNAAAVRWADHGWLLNSQVPGSVLRRAPFRLPRRITAGLAKRLDTGELSARGHDRVLRIAWTISDLDGRTRPDEGDLNEALELKLGEGA